MTKDTSKPAFPGLHPSADCHYQDGGMTLRDYFAAKALQGLLSSSIQPQSGADMIARDAYTVADAMLIEMDK